MRIRSLMSLWLGLALVLLSGPVAGQEPDLSTDAGLEALHEAQRQASGADIGLPDRFALEFVAQDLSFPSAVAVGPDGDVYVAISGFGGNTPEIVRIGAEGASIGRAGLARVSHLFSASYQVGSMASIGLSNRKAGPDWARPLTS